MKKVFLGGTCNGSLWREELIPQLKINYFNPVVDDWNEAAYQQELQERANADYCLYVITPKMTGCYAVAEVVDDSNKRPEKTLLAILKTDADEKFNETRWKSLQAVMKLVEGNGGKVFDSLQTLVTYLNKPQTR